MSLNIKGIIPLFIFIFMISISFATYQNTGVNDYRTGTTLFNSGTSTNITWNTRTINDRMYAPKVADLNNDGENEIILLDGDNVKIYAINTTMNILANYDLGLSLGDISTDLYIYDIDGDSQKEIISIGYGAGITQAIKIIEWNGNTSFTVVMDAQSSDASFFGPSVNGIALGCEAVNKCVAFATSTNVVRYLPFNSTNFTIPLSVQLYSSGDLLCPPNINTVEIVDYNSDGNTEYFISLLEVNTIGQEKGHIISANLNASNTFVSIERTRSETSDSWIASSGGCHGGNNNYGQYITAPQVANLDPEDPSDKEVYFGLNVNANEYKIYAFKLASSSIYDSFKDVVKGEGQNLNNLVIMTSHEDSDANKDICSLGFDISSDVLSLMCGTETRGFSDDFLLTVGVNINLTMNKTHWSGMTHGVEALSSNTITEIITSYGVFSLDDGVFLDSLVLEWNNPRGDSTIIPVDLDGDGRNELLVLSDTNLWIARDGLVNANCNTQNCISQFTTNPSINNVMKVNTTFEATMTIVDSNPDGTSDDVAGKITIYEGTENEQTTSWTTNQSSGTTFSFTGLLLNKTGNNFNLIAMARDTHTPTSTETQSFTFSVGLEGSEFGENTFTYTPIVATDDTVLGVNQNNNSVVNALNLIVPASTGISHQIIWLVIMAILGFFMFSAMGQNSHHLAGMGLIAFVEFVVLLVGYLFGFIGFGTILLVSVVALAIIGVLFGGLITRGTNG